MTNLKTNQNLSVSIVVPFYNRSRFLKRLLDSISAQTLPADKVYIIDNGSSLEETLDAWEIIKSHRLNDKCIFTSSMHSGNANFARNLGYELADTKYVAFLDSDDWWNNNHLIKSVYHLHNSDKAAIYSGANIYTSNGISQNLSIDVNKFNNPFSLVLDDYIAQTSSYVVDKSKILDTVMWDNSLKRHQDFDYFASIFYKTSGWLFSEEVEVNIDWKDGGTQLASIDLNSLKQFYLKWEYKIPLRIRKRYLLSMLYLTYRVKSPSNIREFYRGKIQEEKYFNDFILKQRSNHFYILAYLNIAESLEKVGLKNIVRDLIKRLHISV